MLITVKTFDEDNFLPKKKVGMVISGNDTLL